LGINSLSFQKDDKYSYKINKNVFDIIEQNGTSESSETNSSEEAKNAVKSYNHGISTFFGCKIQSKHYLFISPEIYGTFYFISPNLIQNISDLNISIVNNNWDAGMRFNIGFSYKRLDIYGIIGFSLQKFAYFININNNENINLQYTNDLSVLPVFGGAVDIMLNSNIALTSRVLYRQLIFNNDIKNSDLKSINVNFGAKYYF